MPTVIEICAGAGGQALGLKRAGFTHLALVEIDGHACETLRRNFPEDNIIPGDIREFDTTPYLGVDLLAGGVPCPPFSRAGKQLGEKDERNLFPEVFRLVKECRPKALMIENVPGLTDPVFSDYREFILTQLHKAGYMGEWRKLNACDFGVPQLRPRAILVATRPEFWPAFTWPEGSTKPVTVGEALFSEMARGGWERAEEWAKAADRVAPTLVGGSKKHGGPDLGPTRARKAWASLGVDARSLASEPPPPGFEGSPKLTIKMAAIIQGFPPEWDFAGGKTAAYRQVGNAFPPPVAQAVAERIHQALIANSQEATP